MLLCSNTRRDTKCPFFYAQQEKIPISIFSGYVKYPFFRDTLSIPFFGSKCPFFYAHEIFLRIPFFFKCWYKTSRLALFQQQGSFFSGYVRVMRYEIKGSIFWGTGVQKKRLLKKNQKPDGYQKQKITKQKITKQKIIYKSKFGNHFFFIKKNGYQKRLKKIGYQNKKKATYIVLCFAFFWCFFFTYKIDLVAFKMQKQWK